MTLLKRRPRTITAAAVIIFSVAVVLRAAYFLPRRASVPDWNVDALGYHQLAVNLLEHGVFSISTAPPFQPDAIRTPGYPAFIALVYLIFGESPQAVLLIQVILDSLTALFVMGIAWRLSGSPRAAVFGGIAYALYPTAWRYCTEFYVEIVLAFCVALTFYCTAGALVTEGKARTRAAFGLAAACALSLLVKANTILLPVILIAALLCRRSFRTLAVFVILTSLFLSPWVIRNAVVFGRPMVSNVFENNLARVSAPATLAESRGENVAPWTPRWEELFDEVLAGAARLNPTLFAIPTDKMTPYQLDQVQVNLGQEARRIIARYPMAFVTSHIKGAVRGLAPQDPRFWFEALSGQTWGSVMPEGIARWFLDGRWRSLPPLAIGLFAFFAVTYLIAYTAALVGLWRLLKVHPVMAWATGLAIGYMLLLPGPIAYERFRLPVMPLICALMACALMKGRISPSKRASARKPVCS